MNRSVIVKPGIAVLIACLTLGASAADEEAERARIDAMRAPPSELRVPRPQAPASAQQWQFRAGTTRAEADELSRNCVMVVRLATETMARNRYTPQPYGDLVTAAAGLDHCRNVGSAYFERYGKDPVKAALEAEVKRQQSPIELKR